MANDIRDTIFASVRDKTYTACLTAEQGGVVAGVKRLQTVLEEQRLSYQLHKQDNDTVAAGEVILTLTGTPKEIAVAEEFAIGMLSKPSGIATAARKAVASAGSLRIVSGAWKKMPPEIKQLVREAVNHGGAHFRIVDVPFLYLDKNFVRMLGGIKETLTAVSARPELKVLQLKGETGDIAAEAVLAAECGAGIIMVDTGNVEDLRRVSAGLRKTGRRSQVQLAFAKGISLQNIGSLQAEDIDILDIGMEIIDAPLLDMKLDVVGS
ncbi:quinolinate phosphoribosyl transferase [Sporomusa termitida]|uniref:Putative nicotinate-nucleotide pyrophosphorylase n=1 Tax=Sporomusa termitida TaxID=2377 RepID=A0A517DY43_9FIRM|nr:quinolinate phosphoribosyl transferase [Sporomusa termitida]QDR82275.1 putative nicotinate-nucleotide pyrophosphorylase [Sporomusa termitida]